MPSMTDVYVGNIFSCEWFWIYLTYLLICKEEEMVFLYPIPDWRIMIVEGYDVCWINVGLNLGLLTSVGQACCGKTALASKDQLLLF